MPARGWVVTISHRHRCCSVALPFPFRVLLLAESEPTFIRYNLFLRISAYPTPSTMATPVLDYPTVDNGAYRCYDPTGSFCIVVEAPISGGGGEAA
ncbi:hypothetical protein M422DRAFT_268101 [Sphaerobolus stellatus SS14]|uniref:Uncharacterized protein n=1 Tax=Sphaerobolus stellatus (strain SS14) TaxID=990650 RepID=A0A0C9UYY9_SPHS4|nr:hypothetical protein M422DRAFT_268101 [Sphaerobolus stellatus SS14]